LAFRELRYYLGEACKSLWYNRIMTLTSIVTVTGCLLLFGVFMLFSININYISDQVMAKCEMQAFINEASSEADLARVKAEIEKLDNVASVTAETQEQAFALSKQMMTGNKWNAFVLDLSFIGWDILSGCTLGILGIFYVEPYRNLTYAALYEELSLIHGRPAFATGSYAEYTYQQANPYGQNPTYAQPVQNMTYEQNTADVQPVQDVTYEQNTAYTEPTQTQTNTDENTSHVPQ